MVVEKYINELKEKNDIKTMKGLVREYNKQIDSALTNPVLKESKSNYGFVLIGLFISICSFFVGEISIFVRLLYTFPLFIISIISLIMYLKVKKDGFKNRKLFYKNSLCTFIFLLLIIFTLMYDFQWVLFKSWKEIDYIKSVIILLACLIPIIIATLYDSPKKFMKEFVNTNRKYKGVSSALGGVISVLVIIGNVTKPYYLVLSLSYILILWFTWATTYLVYKYKQYDLIEDLRSYLVEKGEI